MATDFDKIYFNPKNHTYVYEDKSLHPVTSMIKWITPEFKADEILSAVAYKSGKSKAEIQAEWDAKKDVALEKGTRVHNYIENVIEGNDVSVLSAVNDRLYEMDQFDDAWSKICKSLDAKFEKKEWTIGDVELGLAGRVDAIISIMHKNVRKLCIFDWKTGKFTARKYARESMLPPFDDLPCCEEVKYSIQLSLYRLIIERNGYGDIFNSFILHLPADAKYQLYNVVDLRDRLEEWLIDLNSSGKLGDPEDDKRVNNISNMLNSIDSKMVSSISPHSRNRFLEAVKRTLKICN